MTDQIEYHSPSAPFMNAETMLDFTPDLSNAINIAKNSVDRIDAFGLNKWEKRVLASLSEDQTASEIGSQLSLSDYSVHGIANAAAKKLGCKSIAAAVAKAIRFEII